MGRLEESGAGIATPTLVMKSFIERGLLDGDMPHFHVERIPHIGRTTTGERTGRTAWTIPMAIEVLNWRDLYRSLRARVPDAVLHQGRRVIAAQTADRDTGILEFEGGGQEEFDLVVFADGYRSLGRRLLFPDVELQYRGYVLWRGVLEERELDDPEPLESSVLRVGYGDGHGVFYFVPGRDGSVARGERWVNWGCYVRVPAEELPRFLTDRTGRERTGALPPGNMREEEEARLKRWVRDRLPPYFNDIVDRSKDTFAQPIFTAEVPAYYKGRACLIGDAGALAQPFTGSGIFKAMNNAADLVSALSRGETIEAALERWNAEQVEAARRMMWLGRSLEQALIWSVPDFAQMDEAATRKWWQDAATKAPEDLFRSNSAS